jgi:nuclear pore complex protein Nup93
MLHSATVDPFKLALYKLMGKLDPGRRTVPLITSTTEDWLWFQLAMVHMSALFCLEYDIHRPEG